MSRTNKLTVYVSDADQSRIEREAEEAGMSISGYLMHLVETHWRDHDTEAAADQLDVEEKVERIVADAREQLLGIGRDIERRNNDMADMTARAGAYSIANFELLKNEFDPAEARKAQALLTGSRRLREPIDDHPDRNLDLDTDEASDDETEQTEGGSIFDRLRDEEPDHSDPSDDRSLVEDLR